MRVASLFTAKSKIDFLLLGHRIAGMPLLMTHRIGKLLLIFTLTCTGFISVQGADNSVGELNAEAVTRPWKDVVLHFQKSGAVAVVNVTPGTRVKKGALLAQLDDAVEQSQLALLTAQAENRIDTESAKLILLQRQADLKKIEQAYARSAIPEIEVERALLAAKLAEQSLGKANFDSELYKMQRQAAFDLCERMKLVSPVEGIVEEVEIEVGENVSTDLPAIRVVDTSRLWIDVFIPLASASNIEADQVVSVVYSDGEKVDGQVLWGAATVDAASFTRQVRVEILNSSNRPSGEPVKVVFASSK